MEVLGMLRLGLVITAAAALAAAQAAPAKSAPAVDVSGNWSCQVQYQGSTIDVNLHLAKDAQGGLVASLDDVTGGGGAMDASATFKEGQLHVDVPSLPSSFDGALNPDNGAIEGAWSYDGDSVGCNLVKGKS
ncbi:MAG: hypothetical protein ACRD1E_03485 [Terriglobales bacterium]